MRAAAWVSLSLGFSSGLVAAACTSPLPQPMTAADVAELDTGEALVAYLRQPGATPAACDLQAKGPHVNRVGADLATAFVGGLTDGQIDPALWRRCADGLFAGAPPEGKAALFGAVADGYRVLIEDPTFETSPALQARLAAIQTGYIERPVNSPAPAQPGDPFDDLRRAYFGGRLGPKAKRVAGELLAVVDLEHGLYGGRAVDVALLDDLCARSDATLLRRFADRLPSEALRGEARRRVVRLAIAASSYPEVRANREEIETRVLATGMNRVSLAGQPASRATLDAKTISGGTVVVRQDVPYHRSTLVLADHGPGPSVLPELSLRGVLWVDVAGVSRPITLCAPPEALDPSPCVGPEDVKIENPLAYLDRGGAFHFIDHISGQQTVELARGAPAFAIPISVGGRRLAALDWPLQFERPQDLLLSGAGRGPDLTVSVGHPKAARFTFAVTSGSATYQVVIDEPDLGAFRIGSLGAPGPSGFDGNNGTDGSNGMAGSSASCPSMSGGNGSSGGDGSRGGDGQDGGPGSDGGNIRVEVDCGSSACSPQELDALRRMFVSEGGPGGPGGSGGRGGRGGRGGSGGYGTTCTEGNTTTSLSGGTSGFDGSNGSAGSNGRDGAPGSPGQIRFGLKPVTNPAS